jgi:S-adenosylmethionine/arginine decarboxylase-like enzyme
MLSFNQFAVEAIEDPSLVNKDKHENYGQELILDIHDVRKDVYHKEFIREFCERLCDEIGMRKGPNYIWGEEKKLTAYKNPKVDGLSCIQFLYSSSIVLHAIDELGKVFINIFSCKKFDAEHAKNFAIENFGGTVVSYHNIIRK